MVIRKGEDWGWPALPDDDVVLCTNDQQLAELAGEANERGEILKATLTSGDMWRTVGGTDGQPASGPSRCLPLDLGVVRLDGSAPRFFIAHVIAHRRLWQGDWFVAMNAAWFGQLYLGPRAHPNDALLDTTSGRMPLRQRLSARKRAELGTHLPHPDLKTTRAAVARHEFRRPTPVFVDTRMVGRASVIEVSLLPDAVQLFV